MQRYSKKIIVANRFGPKSIPDTREKQGVSNAKVERRADSDSDTDEEEADVKEKTSNSNSDLQKKIAEKNLDEFLRPCFSELLSKTVNICKFATHLFQLEGISNEELDKCVAEPDEFLQNCILYRAVMKRGSNGALIEALELSENAQVLQILQKNLDNKPQPGAAGHEIDPKTQVEIPEKQKSVSFTPDSKGPNNFSQNFDSGPGSKSNFPKIDEPKAIIILVNSSIQTKNAKVTSDFGKAGRKPHIPILRARNLALLQETSNMDNVLLRISTALPVGEKGSRLTLNSIEFHPDPSWALLRFLQIQLQSSTIQGEEKDKKVRDIFIDGRFLDKNQWRILIDLLWACRTSLETLWLDSVNEPAFYSGTSSMATEKLSSRKLKTAFPRLFRYIWSSSSGWSFTDKKLNKILFFKSPETPLSAPELEKLSIDIMDNFDSGCGFYFHINTPKNDSSSTSDSYGDLDSEGQQEVTFFYNWGTELMRNVVNDCIGKTAGTQGLTLTRLYYSGPTKLNIAQIGGENLTHLFIFGVEGNNRQLCGELWGGITKFRYLVKLQIYSSWDWTADLSSLGVMHDLKFMFLGKAKIESGGWPIEMFPFDPEMKMIVLHKCTFETKEVSFMDWSNVKNQTVALTRNLGPNPVPKTGPGASGDAAIPLSISVSTKDLLDVFLHEFFE